MRGTRFRALAEEELTKYTRASYSLEELQKKPEELNPNKLETYLSDNDFQVWTWHSTLNCALSELSWALTGRMIDFWYYFRVFIFAVLQATVVIMAGNIGGYL